MKIRLDEITDRIIVRSVKPQGVERLKRKISEVGYLPEKPILVTPNETGYTLIAGNHREAALKELGIAEVEALVDETLTTKEQQFRRARLSNEVTETLVPTTFVDDAELVWRLSEEGMTQTEIGGVLGWGRGKVSQYAMLKGICEKTWNLIATTMNGFVVSGNDVIVAANATNVAFSEGLLRPIIPLTPDQQLYLVTELVTNDNFPKKKFTKLAGAFKIRNEIKEHIKKMLPELSSEFLEPKLEDVDKGSFDKDWATEAKSKIERFIDGLRAEWEEKSNTKMVCGDFVEEVLKIDDGIVDLVLTDPPYNISASNRVTKRGSEIVNAEFGGGDEWDTTDAAEFADNLLEWSQQWERIMRPGASIVVFCDKILISDLWRIMQSVGLAPKNVIVWAKSNPAPAGLARKNLISATEFMVWAVKPGTGYTFNEVNQWNRHNVISAPICGGNERAKDEEGETLHPTQKPLAVLEPLVNCFSNRGDLVFDGFSGVGSTGEAAVKNGRKFIGIEINQEFFDEMARRVNK